MIKENYYFLNEKIISHLSLCNSERIKKFGIENLTSSEVIASLLLPLKNEF